MMAPFPEKVFDLADMREQIHVYRIVEQVDALYCPNIRSGMSFAVADAYKQWSDVAEEELLEFLKEKRGHAL